MLFLRKITKEDSMLLYNWANESEVRENAISTAPIALSNHLKWFKNKINSANTHIFILMQEGQPIGQIRFDKVDNYYEIDYSIDKKYRGEGHGTLIVKYGIDEMKKIDKDSKIKAIVKLTNNKSGKVFSKLGFTNLGVLENGFNTYTYEP